MAQASYIQVITNVLHKFKDQVSFIQSLRQVVGNKWLRLTYRTEKQKKSHFLGFIFVLTYSAFFYKGIWKIGGFFIFSYHHIMPRLLPEATGGDKKVGVPSMVVTRGFVNPPRSNSWADIFRTGVPDPELPLDPDEMVLLDGEVVVVPISVLRLTKSQLFIPSSSEYSSCTL